MAEQQGVAGFLLTQLFDVTTLELGNRSDVDEAVLASRACFNQDSFRNLEGYRVDLAGVFSVLDNLADEATAVEAESDKVPSNPS